MPDRRSVLAALVALGIGLPASADDCATKCKKKTDKDKRKKCLNQCKKKPPSPPPSPPPLPLPPPPVPPPPPPTRHSVSFSGTGSLVTAPFDMVQGRYIATSSIAPTERTNFIAHLFGPGATYTEDFLVNEIPEPPGPYQYQRVIFIEDTGSHLLEVQYAGGPWTIAIDPA